MKVKSSVISFLLGPFKHRPGMFLGTSHISLLSTFMTGYQIALQHNGFDISTDPFYGKDKEGFFDWYANKLGIKFLSMWHLTILEQANNSEVEGLKLFFKLLEEFCIEKNINMPRKA